MNSIFNLNCTGCPQLLELSVAFKFMTNRFDCTAHPDILSTVSTSPIIDFFLYLFADWDLLNLLELSQELILLLWSIPDTFFNPRNRRERFKGLTLFLCQTHRMSSSCEFSTKEIWAAFFWQTFWAELEWFWAAFFTATVQVNTENVKPNILSLIFSSWNSLYAIIVLKH